MDQGPTFCTIYNQTACVNSKLVECDISKSQNLKKCIKKVQLLLFSIHPFLPIERFLGTLPCLTFLLVCEFDSVIETEVYSQIIVKYRQISFNSNINNF